MIISKTPFRVSLFGGSTDYASYYQKHGALLVGFAIDKYCYISVRKTPKIFNHRTCVSYSKLEKVNRNSDIEHNGVRGTLEYLKIRTGLEIHHIADLPSQTGTGSSSSFIVGLLHALSKIKRGVPSSKKALATTAISIERELLEESGGIQDQIWASYGGLNSIEIEPDGSFEVRPLPLSTDFEDRLLERLVLVYTGKTRKSFHIAKSHDDKESSSVKSEIHKLAQSAYKEICDGDISQIGNLLNESWNLKKQISPLVSSGSIDEFYKELQKEGMIGGKLMGSGGSGFIIGILEEGRKQDFTKKFAKSNVSFGFDKNGTQIMV